MADPDGDRFDLQRFVDAQADVYDIALAELRAGRKQSHWMWFVFPQIQGLGHSYMSTKYAISGLEEARAYIAHEILGKRLIECTHAVLDSRPTNARAVFGPIDSMKFRSCMTLFELAAPDVEVFSRALDALYDGRRDERTLEIVGARP